MEATPQLSGQKRKNGSGRGFLSLVVSTSRPSSTTTAGGGGSLTIICPRTGTVLTSCRIQGGDLQSASNNGLVGVKTLSFFPSLNIDCPAADPSASLAIAYGSSTGKKRSNGAALSYGMLLTVRKSPSASPILHWKCHLPEQDLSGGLLVSPVSRHVVGGGSSGALYVWNPLQGGSLVRTIPSAHYRAITCMQWSTAGTASNAATTTSGAPWDCHLVTGGADGMVHVFSHLDLVEQTSNSVQPIRTWTKHHLAVTSLVALTGGRMASASEDGQVVLMELCSGNTLATFQFSNPIRSLATKDSRLFAGSSKGVVHIVDMDEYALHQTVQMGATTIRQRQHTETLESRVFGTSRTSTGKLDQGSEAPSYQMELKGHDSAITSLVAFEDEQDGRTTEYLASGDEAGLIRVWDSMRGCCVRLIHPWSSSADTSISSGKNISDSSAQQHPATTIQVLREDINPILESSLGGDAIMFGRGQESKRTKGPNGFTSMVSPLQKFATNNDGMNVPLPHIVPRRTSTSVVANLGLFSFEKALTARENKSKALSNQDTPLDNTNKGNQQQQQDEIAKLQKELEEAKETIQRWEVVNNKLMGKLHERS